MVRKVDNTNATSQLNAFIRRATRTHVLEDKTRKLASKTFSGRYNHNRKMSPRKYKPK